MYQNYSLPYMDSIDKSLWSATVDGVELLGSPAERLAEGKVADVPMLFGTNRDEGSTFTGTNVTCSGLNPLPPFLKKKKKNVPSARPMFRENVYWLMCVITMPF